MADSAVLKYRKTQKRQVKNIERIKDQLNIIKEGILKVVPAKTIYLFGSYAYGKPNKKSDIDIYAVIPDDFNEDIIKTMGKVANYIYPYDIFNMDLFLVKENDFIFYKDYSSFEETIFEKGIILYERP
jgi:predicted nucleotidyltransferase